MSVPMIMPVTSGIMTQYEYERSLGNDVSLYEVAKEMSSNPVDEAVQAVRDAQYSVGKGIENNGIKTG